MDVLLHSLIERWWV